MIDFKRGLACICVALALGGCAGTKKVQKPPSGRPAEGVAQGPGAGMSGTRRMILELARREWEFFGKQVVVIEDDNEAIPHVGHWEDDGEPWNSRVNRYWRAAGKPQLDGDDCREPWSAAFVSWIMQESGVPAYQFPPSDAHREYLSAIVAMRGDPDAAFAAHSIADYNPKPGDLICAVRGTGGALPYPGEDIRLVLDTHTKLHCDIVVANTGSTVEAIGGNVRDSVSKTIVRLKANGHLQPTERRPWFMAVENRL